MSHSGNNEDIERFQKLFEEKEFNLTIFGQGAEGGAANQQKANTENELINKLPIETNMNCILLASGG